MNPQFPIYIVSKGRWESRMTVRALDKMSVPFLMVIEEQELPQYASVIPRERLLLLDKDYQRDYETCDELGDSKSKGPGAARNFAWDHSIANGHEWHWVMDDNILKFLRMNRNIKATALDGTIFRCMEDFALRYVNVSMVGPQYEGFGFRKMKKPPFAINTRIYSCNLIRNDVPFRWRGRYNEDTDLSLRMLKAGWCTIQYNAFLQWKSTTQTVKGGNTKDFYEKEGTLPKSEMLVNLHPDVARLKWHFNRWHHVVNYRGFRQKLIRHPHVEVPDRPDEYGMVLRRV